MYIANSVLPVSAGVLLHGPFQPARYWEVHHSRHELDVEQQTGSK